MFDTPFSCLIFPIVSSSPYASCCPYVISCPVGKSSSSGKMDPKVGFICSDEGPNLIHFGVFCIVSQTNKQNNRKKKYAADLQQPAACYIRPLKNFGP